MPSGPARCRGGVRMARPRFGPNQARVCGTSKSGRRNVPALLNAGYATNAKEQLDKTALARVRSRGDKIM